MPLNFTWLPVNVELKFVPLMVIKRPALPVEGLKEVIVGVGNGGGFGGVFSLPPFEQDPRTILKITNKTMGFMGWFGFIYILEIFPIPI
jgi:hypothetical protein